MEEDLAHWIPPWVVDDSVTWTDWPVGTIYEGSVANQSIWSTATNYLGETGSGYLHITQDADTRVFVDGSITSESEGSFNTIMMQQSSLTQPQAISI